MATNKEHLITEGKAKLYLKQAEKISRKMGVFYNPAMKLNRDISILLLNSTGKKRMQIADPLAGTGIRSIRMLLELKKERIKSISINDHSKTAAAEIKRNLKLNNINESRIKTSCKDANIFLLESTGFDYIDIDPFGHPGKFLDAASQRTAREGILAVTATDTAALAGSSPKACMRKYWAEPLRNESMHETGLRILIRRIQLAGMQHEKALTPILAYSSQHYMRAFFTCKKGREVSSNIYKSHGYISFCERCLNREKGIKEACKNCKGKMKKAGPLWLGKLSDEKTASKMAEKADRDAKRLLETIKEESKVDTPWVFNINNICRKYRLKSPPETAPLITKLKTEGHRAAKAHFQGSTIKTTATIKQLVKSIKSFINKK